MQARFACEDCGAPVEQEWSDHVHEAETIQCAECSAKGAAASRVGGAGTPDGRRGASSPVAISSFRRAVEAMRRTREALMAGTAGTDWRAGLDSIRLVSGRMQHAEAWLQRAEQRQDPRAADESGPQGASTIGLAGPGLSAPCSQPEPGSEASPELEQQVPVPQPSFAANPDTQLGQSEAAPAEMQRDAAMADAPQGKRQLESPVSEADTAAKRPRMSSSYLRTEPQQAQAHKLVNCQGPGLAHTDSSAPCAIIGGQRPEAQRHESVQADSRVRIKQRELVPLKELLDSGCAEEEDWLTILAWKHLPQFRPQSGQAWAPSIRSKASQPIAPPLVGGS